MSEQTIETKNCKSCGIVYSITDMDLKFYDKISPIVVGKKIPMAIPSICPSCRQQRRLSWRNERNLYRRKCDATGKSVITTYSPDKPYKIFEQGFWWSDNNDCCNYGREFDFKKPFFEQFRELTLDVPKPNLINSNVENCDYTNHMNDSKNSYLSFASGFGENINYCKWVYFSNNVFDCSYCTNGENSYMMMDCDKFYHCLFCHESNNITECSYCYDCNDCEFCIGCAGLRNKKYHILNHEYTKEEFLEKTKQINIHSEEFINNFESLLPEIIHSPFRIINSENCFGNHIKNSKDCYMCYDIEDGQDCKYNFDMIRGKDSYDANYTGFNELVYGITGGGRYSKSAFMVMGDELKNCYYCVNCKNSSNLFGCEGLQNKEYCILNKQYSKDEYEELLAKIIEYMTMNGEWGEFFPIEVSGFAYNETIAQEYYPLTQEQIKEKGYNWRQENDEINVPKGIETINTKELKELQATSFKSQAILDKAIICEITGRPFKLIKPELDFYIKNNIPLPSKHPDQRHIERIMKNNLRSLYNSNCGKCGIEIRTVYPENFKSKVYCEKCY